MALYKDIISSSMCELITNTLEKLTIACAVNHTHMYTHTHIQHNHPLRQTHAAAVTRSGSPFSLSVGAASLGPGRGRGRSGSPLSLSSAELLASSSELVPALSPWRAHLLYRVLAGDLDLPDTRLCGDREESRRDLPPSSLLLLSSTSLSRDLECLLSDECDLFDPLSRERSLERRPLSLLPERLRPPRSLSRLLSPPSELPEREWSLERSANSPFERSLERRLCKRSGRSFRAHSEGRCSHGRRSQRPPLSTMGWGGGVRYCLEREKVGKWQC